MIFNGWTKMIDNQLYPDLTRRVPPTEYARAAKYCPKRLQMFKA